MISEPGSKKSSENIFSSNFGGEFLSDETKGEGKEDSDKSVKISRPKISRKITDFDKDYIKRNYLVMSDEEIADALGKTAASVYKARKALGFLKDSASIEKNKDVFDKDKQDSISALSDHDRATLAIAELKRSGHYKWIETELIENEKDIYLREFADQIAQLEGITPAEVHSLHIMLMERIKQHRINELKADKLREARAQGGSIDTDALLTLEKEYSESVKNYREIQKTLMLERRERKDIAKNKYDLISLIKKLSERKSRDEIGKEIVETNLATIEYRSTIAANAVFGDQQ
jgi:hypothetical protein